MWFGFNADGSPVRGYTAGMAPAVPAWRRRIGDAVAPHGQLQALATKAEMSPTQLQKIVQGKNKNPRIDTLTRIAKAMGLTLESLVKEPYELAPELKLSPGTRPPPVLTAAPPEIVHGALTLAEIQSAVRQAIVHLCLDIATAVGETTPPARQDAAPRDPRSSGSSSG